MKEKDKKHEQQSEWLKQHTLTWTQNKQLIESKLERAKQASLALRRLEAQLQGRWQPSGQGNASLCYTQNSTINVGGLPDGKFQAITGMRKMVAY